jgi:hypothetical protein
VADKEAQRKAYQAKERQLKEDLAVTFGTPAGRRTLAYIRDICGFSKSCVGGNPQLGMDIKDGTLYNAARQSIYLELRQLIPVRILKPVEFNDKEVIEEIN